MRVDLSGGAPAAPARLFSILLSSDIDGFHYAVSHDCQRILAIKELGRQRSRDLNVVINWPRLLRLSEPTRATLCNLSHDRQGVVVNI